mgnify:CR=1 FL=1
MLKIKDNVELTELEKYGFHSYKVTRSITNWYRCFASGCMLILINGLREIKIEPWFDGDERIHAQPKCHYRDRTSYDEVLYDLIAAGIVEKAPVNEHGKVLKTREV